MKVCCADKAPFPYNPGVCRRYANRCWGFACQWPLCDEPRSHRRALALLVERLMPLLTKPHLATDMLCDSLDAGLYTIPPFSKYHRLLFSLHYQSVTIHWDFSSCLSL